jgi:hypothetical protein
MNGLKLVASLLIGIVLGAAGCYIFLESRDAEDSIRFGSEKEKAYKHLLDSYNPELGLCYEYPNSSRYWVTHDNLLAPYALSNWSKTVARADF